jgi:RNA polymerase sigma-70 factor (ECF subfamily)
LKLDTFDDRSTLKTWIFRIAMNTCKDYFKSWHYRKVRVMQSFESDQSKTGDNPEEQMMQRFQNNVILREILSLSPKFREIILLHYYQDFSLKEIATFH